MNSYIILDINQLNIITKYLQNKINNSHDKVNKQNHRNKM